MNYEEYDDLNKAKQQILKMMQTKYGDADEEYEEEVDTDADKRMNDIISQLNTAISSSFQMIPFIKHEEDKTRQGVVGSRPSLTKNGKARKDRNGDVIYEDVLGDILVEGNSYYRNVNSLLSFNQQTLTLSNALTNLNRIFKTLIQDIGYVEPSTIDTYTKTYDKYERVFNELNQVAVVQGTLKVIMKDGEQNEFDKKNLITEFNNAIAENNELIKYNNMVHHNYNYKSNTIANKKQTYINSNKNDNNYEDDDE